MKKNLFNLFLNWLLSFSVIILHSSFCLNVCPWILGTKYTFFFQLLSTNTELKKENSGLQEEVTIWWCFLVIMKHVILNRQIYKWWLKNGRYMLENNRNEPQIVSFVPLWNLLLSLQLFLFISYYWMPKFGEKQDLVFSVHLFPQRENLCRSATNRDKSLCPLFDYKI